MYYLRLKDQTENKGLGLFFPVLAAIYKFLSSLTIMSVCLISLWFRASSVLFPNFLNLDMIILRARWIFNMSTGSWDKRVWYDHSPKSFKFPWWDKSILRSRKIGKFFHSKQNHEPQQDQGTQQRNHKEQNTGVEWNAWWFKKRCNNTRKS